MTELRDAGALDGDQAPLDTPILLLNDERVHEIEAKIDDLGGRLTRRGEEIDALQVEQAQRKRPFYREPATILAILAILVSIVAALASYVSSQSDLAQQRDESLVQQRVRLTTVMQEIADWRAQDSPKVEKGRSVLDEAYLLVGLLNGSRYRASAYEKHLIANGFTFANEPERAVQLAAEAESESQSSPLMQDRTSAAGALAAAYFQSMRPMEGRAAYRRELSYIERSSGYVANLTSSARFEVFDRWVTSELYYDNCAEARARYEDAKNAVTGMSVGRQKDFVERIQALEGELKASACP